MSIIPAAQEGDMGKICGLRPTWEKLQQESISMNKNLGMGVHIYHPSYTR
jgi:hypothetical protein